MEEKESIKETSVDEENNENEIDELQIDVEGEGQTSPELFKVGPDFDPSHPQRLLLSDKSPLARYQKKREHPDLNRA